MTAYSAYFDTETSAISSGNKEGGKVSPLFVDAPEDFAPVATFNRRHRGRSIAFGWYGGKFSHLDWLLMLLPACLIALTPFSCEDYFLDNNKAPNHAKDKASNSIGVCGISHDSEIVSTHPIQFWRDLQIDDAADFFRKSGGIRLDATLAHRALREALAKFRQLRAHHQHLLL
jgi:hypothetical protein